TVVLDQPRGLQAVHARHAPIHEDYVVRLVGIPLLNGCERLSAGADAVHTGSQGAEGLNKYFPRSRVVVHHKHPEILELAGQIFARASNLAHTQPNRKHESATHTRFTLKPDLAAHQFDQPSADREP